LTAATRTHRCVTLRSWHVVELVPR